MQDIPLILSAKTFPTETGLKLEFLLSSYIKREDVSSWIEQENWFILNFYNIIRPDTDFFKNMITYPVREVQQSWLQNSNSLQLSIQINRSIGIFDVIIHDEGRKINIIITYSDFVDSKEANPSFIFPDPKISQKKFASIILERFKRKDFFRNYMRYKRSSNLRRWTHGRNFTIRKLDRCFTRLA